MTEFRHWPAGHQSTVELLDDQAGLESTLSLVAKEHTHGFVNGAVYGFVMAGESKTIGTFDAKAKNDHGHINYAIVTEGHGLGIRHRVVGPKEYFCTAGGMATVQVIGSAEAICVQRHGFLGVSQMGGPVEELGRLRYIDGCSDSLLIPPPYKGDPCLNLLHFPADIDQTAHTHPSVRMGCVAKGAGVCVTWDDPEGEPRELALVPGVVFSIPAGCLHKFRTGEGGGMDVIAYHPDSDFGPESQEHPMVNRTLVDGQKIDNTVGVHAEAEIIVGANALPFELPSRI